MMVSTRDSIAVPGFFAFFTVCPPPSLTLEKLSHFLDDGVDRSSSDFPLGSTGGRPFIFVPATWDSQAMCSLALVSSCSSSLIFFYSHQRLLWGREVH